MKFKQYRDYESLNIGDRVTLIEERNILTGEHWKRAVQADGIGGNKDSSIKLYHGWRGTTNDIERYALGLREITGISEIKEDRKGDYYVTVTVGPDLLPNVA